MSMFNYKYFDYTLLNDLNMVLSVYLLCLFLIKNLKIFTSIIWYLYLQYKQICYVMWKKIFMEIDKTKKITLKRIKIVVQ